MYAECTQGRSLMLVTKVSSPRVEKKALAFGSVITGLPLPFRIHTVFPIALHLAHKPSDGAL
jgi:hypothetical protein